MTSLLGLIGCLIMCFFINYVYALISVAMLIVLIVGLHMRGFQNSWGSISQALIFHQVRKYLLMLDFRKDHIKFWRPHMLLLVANPRFSSQLIDFINDLKKSGMYVVAHVKTGDFKDEKVDPLQEEYLHWVRLIEQISVKAFVELTMASTVREGVWHLVRLSGLGGMKPNTVCFGFYDDSPPVDTLVRFKPKSMLNKTFIKLRTHRLNNRDGNNLGPFEIFDDLRLEKAFSNVDYVLMIQDALKLRKNVCLFRHFENMDKVKVKNNGAPMFIDMWPVNFFDIFSTSVNFDKTCLFLLQLGCILHMVPGWRKHTKLRIFACSRSCSQEMQKMESQLAEFLNLLRIRAEIRVVDVDDISYHYRISSEFPPDSDPILSDSYPVEVNRMIKHESSETAVVFVYLPAPPSTERKQVTYLRQLDLLTQDLPPTVLVHGLQPVICTSL